MIRTPRGIQIVRDESEAARIKDVAMREGLRVWTVNLAEVASKASLLDAIGKSLSFPDYYGHNWDALEECLRDLNDSGNGWVITFEQADALLALPQQDVGTLASILSDTSNFWSAEDKTFGAMFVGSPNLNRALAA